MITYRQTVYLFERLKFKRDVLRKSLLPPYFKATWPFPQITNRRGGQTPVRVSVGRTPSRRANSLPGLEQSPCACVDDIIHEPGGSDEVEKKVKTRP